jgi:hypothetical protein
MKKTLVAAVAATLVGTGAASAGQWQRIGPGPSFDYAEAQCNLMAMGAGGGHFAMGSPEFVIGASIGAAIGDAIQTAYVKKQCMVLQGWKFVYGQTNAPLNAPTKVVKKNGKLVKVQQTARSGQICQTNPRACQ